MVSLSPMVSCACWISRDYQFKTSKQTVSLSNLFQWVWQFACIHSNHVVVRASKRNLGCCSGKRTSEEQVYRMQTNKQTGIPCSLPVLFPSTTTTFHRHGQNNRISGILVCVKKTSERESFPDSRAKNSRRPSVRFSCFVLI